MGRKKIIIVDLDGTIAKDTFRNHHLHKPTGRDWDAYYSLVETDEPNWPVINLLRLLVQHFQIYILSGRRGDTMVATQEWLRKFEVPYDYIRLREVGDRTQDNTLKLEWAKEIGLGPDEVEFILEDRERVVRAWRDAGYVCFQVADGTF